MKNISIYLVACLIFIISASLFSLKSFASSKASNPPLTSEEFLKLMDRTEETFEQIESLYQDRLDFIKDLRDYLEDPKNTTFSEEMLAHVNRILNLNYMGSTKALAKHTMAKSSEEYYEQLQSPILITLESLEDQTKQMGLIGLRQMQTYTQQIRTITDILAIDSIVPIGDTMDELLHSARSSFEGIPYPINFDTSQNIYELFMQIHFCHTLYKRNQYLERRGNEIIAMISSPSHNSLPISISYEEFQKMIPVLCKKDFNRQFTGTNQKYRLEYLLNLSEQESSQYFLEEGKNYLQFLDEILRDMITSGAVAPSRLHPDVQTLIAKDYWFASHLCGGNEDSPLPDKSIKSFAVQLIEQFLIGTRSHRQFKAHLARKEALSLQLLRDYTPKDEESAADILSEGHDDKQDNDWLEDLTTKSPSKKSKSKGKKKKKGKGGSSKPPAKDVEKKEDMSLFEDSTEPKALSAEGEGRAGEGEEVASPVAPQAPESLKPAPSKAKVAPAKPSASPRVEEGAGGGGESTLDRVSTLLEGLQDKRKMRWNDFTKHLKRQKAYHLRTRGSHETWDIEGQPFTIVKPHPHSTLGFHQLTWFKKTIQKRFGTL